MLSTPNILEYYIDTSGYYPYLMFSPDIQGSSSHILQDILAPLQKAVPALELTRVMGRSSRPAADGNHYTNYARLAQAPSQLVSDELYRFLSIPHTSHRPVKPSIEQVRGKSTEVDEITQLYKGRLEKAKVYFREMDNEIRILKLDLQNLTTKNRRLVIENACANDEQKSIAKKLTAIKNTHKKVKAERSELRDHVSSLSHDLEQTKIEVGEYKKANRHLVKKTDESLLKSLKSQLKKSTDLLIKKDSQVSLLRDEIEDLNAQIPTETNTVNSDDLSAAEKLLEELESEKIKLLEEISKLEEKELETPPPRQKSDNSNIVSSIYGDRITLIEKSERLLFDQSTADGIRMKVFDYIVWILHNTTQHMTDHKKVQSLTHWYEADVGRDYRLYYRKLEAKRCHILFDLKTNQTSNFKQLGRRDS